MPNVNLTLVQCALLCSVLRAEDQRLAPLCREAMPEIRHYANERRALARVCQQIMEAALASSKHG